MSVRRQIAEFAAVLCAVFVLKLAALAVFGLPMGQAF